MLLEDLRIVEQDDVERLQNCRSDMEVPFRKKADQRKNVRTEFIWVDGFLAEEAAIGVCEHKFYIIAITRGLRQKQFLAAREAESCYPPNTF